MINSFIQQITVKTVTIAAAPVIMSPSAFSYAQDPIPNLSMFSSEHQEEIKSKMISEAYVAIVGPPIASDILLSYIVVAADLEPAIPPSDFDFVLPSGSISIIQESSALIVSHAGATSDRLLTLTARPSSHDNRLSEIKYLMLLIFLTIIRLPWKFAFENVKRTCDSINDLVKSVSFNNLLQSLDSIFLRSLCQRTFSISVSASHRCPLSFI